MRRLAALLSLATLFSLAPAPVAAAARSCRVEVTPSRGQGTTTYRISGKHFPSTVDGSPLEVQIDVTRISLRDPNPEHAIFMWLWLIPGGHQFYVDYSTEANGQAPLKPGRYLVAVETPHQAGCHTHAVFAVGSKPS
jgi:hypothetical protein